jgi:hypothetical protein
MPADNVSVNKLFIWCLSNETIRKDSKLMGKEGRQLIKESLRRVRGHCVGCDVDIGLPGASFCPYCGETLQSILPQSLETTETTKMSESQRATETENHLTPSCMICSRQLRPNDPTFWCPFCGHPAHQKEFKKWMSKKGTCPTCKAQYSENVFRSWRHFGSS